MQSYLIQAGTSFCENLLKTRSVLENKSVHVHLHVHKAYRKEVGRMC